LILSYLHINCSMLMWLKPVFHYMPFFCRFDNMSCLPPNQILRFVSGWSKMFSENTSVWDDLVIISWKFTIWDDTVNNLILFFLNENAGKVTGRLLQKLLSGACFCIVFLQASGMDSCSIPQTNNSFYICVDC